MKRKTLHDEWKSFAASLIVAASSVGGLSALAGCDQSNVTQIASQLASGGSDLGDPTTSVEVSKSFAEMRLSSNHNETFLID